LPQEAEPNPGLASPEAAPEVEQNILESRQEDGTDLLEPELEQAGNSDKENLEQAANSETPGVNVIKLFFFIADDKAK
jgi:hypothetical protein